MSDERLKKDTVAGGRESRASEDKTRASADTELASAQERRRMFRSEWIQEALPTPPEIPGYHLCWLSTTNQYDPIHKRMRLGYEPVKADDIPGCENLKVKAGEMTGFVACNEMVLYKMPMEIYQEIMTELHYNAPREEAEKIRSQVDNFQSTRDSNGRRLGQVEGEGLDRMNEVPPAPVFT